MMLRRNLIFFTGLLGLFFFDGLVSGQLAAQEYKIIVNIKNPVDSLTKKQACDIFLKKVKTWEHGPNILVVDLIEASSVRATFSKDIHGRSVAAVKSYWNQKIYSGRGVPPPEKASEKEVLEYVQADSGAIGYVSGTAAIEKVKVLKIME